MVCLFESSTHARSVLPTSRHRNSIQSDPRPKFAHTPPLYRTYIPPTSTRRPLYFTSAFLSHHPYRTRDLLQPLIRLVFPRVVYVKLHLMFLLQLVLYDVRKNRVS